jgi:acyl-CoA synthetase (AMP-forming)/AMP-acid ligase II
MKLVDDEGVDITDYDIRGELCVRGPTVINGYLDDNATARSWDKDGFFHTGDVAYCDGKTEKWYIVDRKKELIKVRGFQVAPPELEAVLISHEHIVDAGVIGVQPFDGDQSEYPRAYVVRRDSPEGKRLSEGDVKKHIADRLARYKSLDGGVVFVDEIVSVSSRIHSCKLRTNVLTAEEPKWQDLEARFAGES